MKVAFASVIGLIAIVLAFGTTTDVAQGGKKPKYDIGEVMKKAMKSGLCKKVASGKASADEKAELVELFVALSQNTPEKGSKESWEEKTGALVAAAKAAAKGDKGAGKALGKAANCGACHKAHK